MQQSEGLSAVIAEVQEQYSIIKNSHEKIMAILDKYQASVESDQGYFFHDEEVLNGNFEAYSIELQTILKEAEKRFEENNVAGQGLPDSMKNFKLGYPLMPTPQQVSDP